LFKAFSGLKNGDREPGSLAGRATGANVTGRKERNMTGIIFSEYVVQMRHRLIRAQKACTQMCAYASYPGAIPV
jgi:hypothetical protein